MYKRCRSADSCDLSEFIVRRRIATAGMRAEQELTMKTELELGPTTRTELELELEQTTTTELGLERAKTVAELELGMRVVQRVLGKKAVQLGLGQ